MAEVLSQSQIDALLNSVLAGDMDDSAESVEPEKYRKYDFYSPKKFTKDKLKIIRAVHENYSRILSSHINSLFRTTSEVEVETVEEQRFYEFNNALAEYDILTVTNINLFDNSKNPPVLIHITTPLMVNMIDRMLGGEDDISVEPDYNYTDIELALYKMIVQYMTAIIGDAWSTYIKLGCEFSKIASNPTLLQTIGADETVIIITISVKMSEVTGKFNVCIPGGLLNNIFTLMDMKSSEEEEENEQDEEEILSSIRNSPLSLEARLGNVQVSLEDIYRLQVGDVINLNKPKDSDVSIYIGGRPWFAGKLGVRNKYMAVRISEVCKEPEA